MAFRFIDDKFLFVDDAMTENEDCCCECADCCDALDLPADIIVDLGAPGLGDGVDCQDDPVPVLFHCDDIAGEFTVVGFNVFEEDNECFAEQTFFLDGVNPQFCNVTSILFITVRLKKDGDNCHWEVDIQAPIYAPWTGVFYKSTPKVFVEADCTLSAPITLTKQSQGMGGFCTGNFDNTITIEAAP